jgi:hypothetical protein
MNLGLPLAFLFSLAAVACGSAPPADAKAPDPAAPGAAVPRPACIAIHTACDPYENETPKGKECHDLGESPATTDAVCEQHRPECLAACPKK